MPGLGQKITREVFGFPLPSSLSAITVNIWKAIVYHLALWSHWRLQTFSFFFFFRASIVNLVLTCNCAMCFIYRWTWSSSRVFRLPGEAILVLSDSLCNTGLVLIQGDRKRLSQVPSSSSSSIRNFGLQRPIFALVLQNRNFIWNINKGGGQLGVFQCSHHHCHHY